MLSIIQAAGWPIWPLIVCSIVALALVIERLSSLRESRVAPQAWNPSRLVAAAAAFLALALAGAFAWQRLSPHPPDRARALARPAMQRAEPSPHPMPSAPRAEAPDAAAVAAEEPG